MKTFILILSIVGDSSYPGYAVAIQEFSSSAACEYGGKMWLHKVTPTLRSDGWGKLTYVCVPK